MIRRCWLTCLALTAFFLIAATPGFAQDIDEDVALADEERRVEAAAEQPVVVEDGEGLVVEEAPVVEVPEAAPEVEVPVDDAPVVEIPADVAVEDVPVVEAGGETVDALAAEALGGEAVAPVADEVVVEDAPVADEVVVEDAPVADAEVPVAIAEEEVAIGGEEAPAVEIPDAEGAVAEEVPAVEVPVDDVEVPVADAEVPVADGGEEAPAVEVPDAEGAVAEEVPAVEVPVADVPAEVEEVPVVDVPAADAPAAEVPVEMEEAPVVEAEPVEDEGTPVVEAAVPEEVPVVEAPPVRAPVRAPARAPVAETSEGLADDAFRDAISEGIPKPPKELVGAGVPSDPRSQEIRLIKDAEVLRRTAYARHARETLRDAEQKMAEKKYPDAIRLFEETTKTFQQVAERPEERADRARARNGLADAYYRYALLLYGQNDLETADAQAKNARAAGHPKAQKLIEAIELSKQAPPAPKAPKKPPVWEEKEQLDKEKGISELIQEGLQSYQADELDRAQSSFERVLKRDPYNTEAIRMMHKTSQRRLDIGVMERESLRKDMIAEVVRTWNPRDYGIDERLGEAGRDGGMTAPPVDLQRERILKKMEEIKIPEIDFRQANINDVVTFLQEASREFDVSDDEGKTKGVNIILQLEQAGAAAAPAAGDDEEDIFGGGDTGDAAAGGAGQIPLVTFTARYISLLEALNIVTKVAGLKYRIEGSVVMVLPINAPEGELMLRMYDVLPTFIDKVTAAAPEVGDGGGGGDGAFRTLDPGSLNITREPIRDFFTQLGVKWPDGSKIRHIASIGKVVLVNTADNIAVFEKVLSILNVVPSQIEIEARFVEVKETDIDSLGIEWLLNSTWTVAQRKGQQHLPVAQRERIQVDANASSKGFTKGLQFARDIAVPGVSGLSLADDIVSFTSVLTEPEMSAVLHALQRRGNADVLSAPKVTTQSGAEAIIKVVTEYIYPTEFTVTPIMATDDNGTSAVAGGIVEPGSFETREVGVILQVVPEVTPDGQMINLTMAPQVVSDPVWHEYGSTYTDSNGNVQQLNMQQPFFHTRTVQTSISIFNGATVVMGGMITEAREDVDDKIPLLGDIPLLGRLFRSKYDQSIKHNLLIFVTAKQVDPAGRVLKRAEPLQPMVPTAAAAPAP